MDWKSDANPTEAVEAHYRAQLPAYLSAVGAELELLVFLAIRQCDEVAR